VKTKLNSSERRIDGGAEEFRPVSEQKLRKVEAIGQTEKCNVVHNDDLHRLKNAPRLSFLSDADLQHPAYVSHQLVGEDAIRSFCLPSPIIRRMESGPKSGYGRHGPARIHHFFSAFIRVQNPADDSLSDQ
jgi:hypothetical protein